MLGKCAGIDVLDAKHTVFGKIIGQRLRGAPIGRSGAELADDKTTDVRACRLAVERIDAVIPDLRIGHRDDLATIRRVGDHLLISCHRGVKTNLSGRRSSGTERISFECATVFKC